jgi:hypothetical protein
VKEGGTWENRGEREMERKLKTNTETLAENTGHEQV